MRALVVDDSATMRMILRRMLEELGFQVSGAGDGEAAIAVLDAGVIPDLLLVDWNMPGMSGLDFVITVRHPPYGLASCIVMVTTETEAPRVVAALEAGADEYVMKPFTKESLFEKLQLLGFGDGR